jgi:hypothetical protein
MLKEGFVIDGIKWIIGQHPPKAIPLCPKDLMELEPPTRYEFVETKLKCEKCGKTYSLPRSVEGEREYVLKDINSRTYKTMRFINLDDEAIPIAEDKTSSKNNKFFVVSRLMESKTGLRLVVYAGEKGKEEKTQIFVEPEIKRLSFDQKDLHPTDVFTKLEATFSDGTKASQEKKK